jgi:apolipoprotein N-acyltransferase
MTAARSFFLSALSGLLLALSWPVDGLWILLFVALIPLLWVEDAVSQKGKKVHPQFFMLAVFSSLIWNIGTTWWIYNASLGGAAMAIIANSLLMGFIWYLAHVSRVKTKHPLGIWSLVVYWIAFETIHYEWDIMWPWLNLGNGLAGHEKVIQWFEYTGLQGGSLWILVLNLMLFNTLKKCKEKGPALKPFVQPALVMLIPVLISLGIFYTYREEGKAIRTILLQPNIDPYTEKFNGIPAEEQLQIMLRMASQAGLDTADLLVGPETALVGNIWENELETDEAILKLRSFLQAYPRLNLLMGASTAYLYQPGEKLSETARQSMRGERWWDSYNTGLMIQSGKPVQLYHKSKLVPGVEKMPWPFLFKYIESFAIDLGGSSGSLGVQPEPGNFQLLDGDEKVAPIICYESVFPEYVSHYVKKGASLLAIITNDGWWGDTPGYRQHLRFGAMRAIETRRSIVRSANTGISCFINQRGEILQPTSWWVPATQSGIVYANHRETFFVKFGNVLGKTACGLSVLLLLGTLFLGLKGGEKNLNSPS